jgi:UDP-glucose 4-epimerase
MKTDQKILITGGAGSTGKYLTESLLKKGYEVRVIDREVEPLRSLEGKGLTLIQDAVENREVLRSAMEGVDSVFHLSWSFSGEPLEVLDQDLKGHIYLLEEAVAQKIRHLIYTSTAVVYGKPRYSPIDEGHPLVVEEARKPLYGIAKAAAEKLCLMYWKQKELPATIIRFWWGYGEDIAGRHLREMLKTASRGEALEVPGDSGGSFLYYGDFVKALDLALYNPKAFGETFNISTVYVTWEDVAGMIREVTGSACDIRVIPRDEWQGSAFLADPWELSGTLSEELLGYRPTEAAEARTYLKKAISATWEGIKDK